MGREVHREEKGKIRASHEIEGLRFRLFQMVTSPNLVVLLRLLGNVQKEGRDIYKKSYEKPLIPYNNKTEIEKSGSSKFADQL